MERRIEKSGAVFSTIGVALLIAFVITLLVFPIIKQCQRPAVKCEFHSTAPDSVRFIVGPIFLAIALVIIAIGVGMIRFAVWYQYKKIKKST